MALKLMGDTDAALGYLAEAVRLDPQLAQAHSTIGTLLERSGRDGEAIDHFMLAARHDPGGEARFRLAEALRRAGRIDASLSHYEQVIERSEASFGQAMALVQLRRYSEARDRLTSGMDGHPWEPAFPLALARLLAASPDDQIRDGQRALELVQALELRTTAVAETMAMAHAELGQFREAVEWQRLAMSVAAEAGQSEAARQMSTNLLLYLRGQPCRTPWRDDELE